MSTKFSTRIQMKRDTSSNWTSNNPVLLDGEIIIVDTADGDTRIKIGNGASTYTQLPFSDEYIFDDINNCVKFISQTLTDGQKSQARTNIGAMSSSVKYAGSSTQGGAATSADKLSTARTIRTNLGSTSAASFNGENNVTPGVTGTLPIANGGTGATTAAKALSNLGLTATAAELNYTDGVRQNIQTQLDDKLSLSEGGHVSASTTIDDLTAGDLLVNGAARFTNGMIGNLTGTASKATADASGNTITTSYASSLAASGRTLTLKSKSGATLSTVTTQDTTYNDATQSAHGLMSVDDKKKLDGIANNANNYTLPIAKSDVLGGVKTGNNITNTDGTISITKENVTNALGYTPPTTDTNTWRGIQNNLTSDSTTDSLSAAQGKVLKTLVDGKSDSGHTHDDRYYTESEIDTKLKNKSDTHSHPYLPVAGGTMTGDITFSAPTSAGQTRGFKFNGVTDSAALYYVEPNLKDDGRMRFDIRDNTNDCIEFAWSLYNPQDYNGTNPFVRHTFDFNGYTTPGTITAGKFSGPLTGNASTATKLATARTIQTNLGSTSSASFDGSGNITPGVSGTLPISNGGTGATTASGALSNLGITASATELNYVKGVTSSIQTQLNGKAASSHGTHVTYGTANPAANGTASPGSASSVSRSDHVHPLQVNVSGNAGTADKLKTARQISLTGSVTGSGNFDGSGNLSITTTTNHTHTSIEPIDSKTYTGIYGSSNDQNGASFYFASVVPNDFYTPWYVRYTINSSVTNQNEYKGYFEVEFWGSKNTIIAYKIQNNHVNTGARTLYYHNVYRLKSAGFNNKYGHMLGIGLRNSANSTNSSYQRTFTIKLIEKENCSVGMLESMVKITSVSGYGSTNYEGVSEYDGSNNGLRETGDDNTYDRLALGSTKVIAGTNGIFPYTIIMKDGTGKYQSLVKSSGTSSSKEKNPSGFDINAPMYYYSDSQTVSSGNAIRYTWTLFVAMNLIDYRYSTNATTGSLTAHNKLFIVGEIKNDGLFYLSDKWWSDVLPTSEDGKVYVDVGYIYPDTTTSNGQTVSNTYRLSYYDTKAFYWYKNGCVRKYPETGYVTNINVPSDAVFTDTKYSAGTGISLSGTTFSNSGVRSIAEGTANGTISVNTNGATTNVPVHGLGSAAYTASTAYATSGHTHAYLPTAGGNMTGRITRSSSGNWIDDRTNSIVFNTYDTRGGYVSVAGFKTVAGSWSIGRVFDNENLIFNYVTDENYDSRTNDSTVVYLPAQAGTIITSATIGNQNVASATKLSGFSAVSTQTWGNQTGTFVHGENDSTGGSFAFRRDNPNNGQMSMIIDGRFYQDEGKYMCLDTNNYKNYALPLSGGTMGGTAMISWPDTGNWSNKNEGVTFPVKRGGLSWAGQSDGIQLFAQETANNNLELILKFTDDNSNGLTIQNKAGDATARITATGDFTGSTHWDKISGKPSTYTPSSHVHDAATQSANGFMSADDKKKLDSYGNTLYYIEGPSTDTTAGTWTGTDARITSYYDGLTIIYKPAVAGASTTTLNINGLGAKTCYYSNTSKLTTHFAVGTPIMFTYVGGAWKRADYDSNTNTAVRIYKNETGTYPLVASRTAAGSITSGSTTVYGEISETNPITMTPSEGAITATKFNGSLNGNATSADKLKTARSVKVNLATTTASSFDGGADITPGVSGTLPVANGGTGKTTGADAANYFINSLSTGDSIPVDNDYYVAQYVNGGTTTTTYHRRPISKLWEYIKSKTESLYAKLNHTHATSVSWENGTGAGPTLKVTAGGSAQQTAVIPSATASVSGVVTTGSQTIAGAKTFSGVTKVSNTTASTSMSTGALQVAGGAGVKGRMSAGEVMVCDHVTLTYSNDALNFVFS